MRPDSGVLFHLGPQLSRLAASYGQAPGAEQSTARAPDRRCSTRVVPSDLVAPERQPDVARPARLGRLLDGLVEVGVRARARDERRPDALRDRLHLADLDDYAVFNEEYAKHFAREKPVRTTVRADLVAGMHVEITVVATQP